MRCITVPNFVKISQSVVKILRFFDFSSWICFGAYVAQPRRVLGGSYHFVKLVMIDAVVLIIYMFYYF